MAKPPPVGFYVYAYLDPRKPGVFTYGDATFEAEPFYIGKGQRARLYRQLQPANASYHCWSKIGCIRRDGLEPIIVCYRDGLAEPESLALEVELISRIGRSDLKAGPLTNKTSGGDGTSGYRWSEKDRQRISAQLTGRKQPPEVRAKRAAAMRGRVVSAETRAKIASAHLGKPKRRGWRHSDAAREKMRGPKSAEQVANMKLARQGRPPMSEETRNKIRATLTGRPLPEAVKAKLRGKTPWNKRQLSLPLTQSQA
jgi:hypothetical protein